MIFLALGYTFETPPMKPRKALMKLLSGFDPMSAI